MFQAIHILLRLLLKLNIFALEEKQVLIIENQETDRQEKRNSCEMNDSQSRHQMTITINRLCLSLKS